MQSLERKDKNLKMARVLDKNGWSSSVTLANIRNLNLKLKDELCTIVFDGLKNQPEVFEVFVDVFEKEKRVPKFGFLPFEVNMILEEDGGFVVKVPSLPGCISQGETKEQAYENIADAIEGYLECVKRFKITIPST